VALPELHEPIEVERSAGELPKVGSFDLRKKAIQIAKALPGGEGPHARLIEARHDDDENFFFGRSLLRLLAADCADYQFIRRRRRR
jgi:hypothetical protein